MRTLPQPAPPSDDKRWRIIDATMRRNGYKPSALIEALHSAQESFGFLADDALNYVAKSLHVPPSKVYGAASFYHYFNFKPAGRHTCVVCTGTACYIKGAGEMIAKMQEQFGISPGETTPDGELSLITARCIGSCGLAPVAVIDQKVAGKVAPGEFDELVRKAVQP